MYFFFFFFWGGGGSKFLYYYNGVQKHEGFVGFENACSRAKTNAILIFFFCCIWFFTSRQQFFSYVGTGFPGLNQS